MTDVDPALAQKAQDIEITGKARYGDNWPVMVDAISRVLPKTVNPIEVVRAAAATDDPARTIAAAGKEALAAMASDGNREAETAYSKIRSEERTAYRRSRGLIR
jgi:hypothetical protein